MLVGINSIVEHIHSDENLKEMTDPRFACEISVNGTVVNRSLGRPYVESDQNDMVYAVWVDETDRTLRYLILPNTSTISVRTVNPIDKMV